MKTAHVVSLMPIACLAIACGAERPAVEEPVVGVFESAPCPVDIPGTVEGETLACGWVRVPEFHDKPNERTLSLAVAIFPALAETPLPDPLVIAPPGPGSSSIANIGPDVASEIGNPLRAERDVILIENRGLPLSEPALLCDEVVDDGFARLEQNLSNAEALPRIGASYRACAERLRAAGVDLRAFTFEAIADDMALVLTALGYERFNLYGTSAGSAVGQYLLRDHPERLRAVIIDSVPPIGRPLLQPEDPKNVADTLHQIFTACASDAACAAAYPDVEAELDNVIAALNEQPVVVAATDPRTGREFEAVFNGDRLAEVLLMAVAQTPWIPRLPGFVQALAQGSEEALAGMLWGLMPQPEFSYGLGASALCSDFFTFDKEDTVFAGLYPHLERGIATASWGPEGLLHECEAWGFERRQPSTRRPVESDVPTLILAGQLDAICPPAWAHDAARSLSNSHVVEIPGFGHSPTFSGACPATLALQFLADPTKAPDPSCIEELQLTFPLPEESAAAGG